MVPIPLSRWGPPPGAWLSMRMTASWFGLPYGPPNTRSQRTLCASQTGSAFDHLGPFDPRLKRRAQDRQGRFALLCSALRASLTAPARGAGEKSGRNEGMPAPAEQRNGGNDAGVLTSRSPYKRHVSGALDSPFVVLLEQDRADEADDGVIIGKDATTSVLRLISPLRNRPHARPIHEFAHGKERRPTLGILRGPRTLST
ncbi:hypothetical protein ABIA23_005234 [Sinorhizobium fredii]